MVAVDNEKKYTIFPKHPCNLHYQGKKLRIPETSFSEELSMIQHFLHLKRCSVILARPAEREQAKMLEHPLQGVH